MDASWCCATLAAVSGTSNGSRQLSNEACSRDLLIPWSHCPMNFPWRGEGQPSNSWDNIRTASEKLSSRNFFCAYLSSSKISRHSFLMVLPDIGGICCFKTCKIKLISDSHQQKGRRHRRLVPLTMCRWIFLIASFDKVLLSCEMEKKGAFMRRRCQKLLSLGFIQIDAVEKLILQCPRITLSQARVPSPDRLPNQPPSPTRAYPGIAVSCWKIVGFPRNHT